jgi:hypothetical protein
LLKFESKLFFSILIFLNWGVLCYIIHPLQSLLCLSIYHLASCLNLFYIQKIFDCLNIFRYFLWCSIYSEIQISPMCHNLYIFQLFLLFHIISDPFNLFFMMIHLIYIDFVLYLCLSITILSFENGCHVI